MIHLLRTATAAIVLMTSAACVSSPETALRVDSVRYDDDAVSAISPEDRARLVDLTALGVMVSRGEAAEVGAPLVRRARERSQLLGLPLHLAARARRIDEAELRELYEAEPEWELTVRHLVRLTPRWAPAAEREAARRAAEEARARAVSGEDFAGVAAEFSEEPGADQRGGLLEPGRRGTWVDPFWEAAAALEPGEISPVVETQYGYHVIRLESRERVPFQEADRTRLLSRVVPQQEAAAAMEDWVTARAGALSVNEAAIIEWFPRLRAGDAPRDVVFARWSAGLEEGSEGDYAAWDAALFRAALPGEQRERLDAAGAEAFAQRIDQDARETMLSVDALRFGASASERATREAEATWDARVDAWAGVFGFRVGMSEEQIAATALRGLTARSQDAVIARQELTGVRPLLRRSYEVSGRLAPPSTRDNNSSTP